MTLLELGLVGVWVVVIVCLLLVLAVLRRITLLSERMSSIAPTLDTRGGLVRGDPFPSFTATDWRGQERESLSQLVPGRRALVAILSASCESCREEVPEIRKVLGEANRSGDWSVLVLVVGDGESTRDLVNDMGDAAPVWMLEYRSAADSLQVALFPTYYEVDERGNVVRRMHEIRGLESIAPLGKN